MTAPERPVRVTLTGTARPLLTNGDLLRVSYGGTVLLLDPANKDAGVEWLDPDRDWRDGDVVAGGESVWSRLGGKWHQLTEHGISIAFDPGITAGVLEGAYAVLRYQAGER